MSAAEGAGARRVALLGGESTGKTTLARALAAALPAPWVPEYGRTVWEQLRRTLDNDELVAVAQRQVALEDAAVAAADGGWVICDTTPLTTLQYALHDHGRAPAALRALAARRYDCTLVCMPDFEFVQDGCRRDDGYRAEQHAWTLRRLGQAGVRWHAVSGSADERLRAALQVIAAA